MLEYKAWPDRSTNNRAEVIALKLVLILAVEKKKNQKLQVMGDSKVLIDRIRSLCYEELSFEGHS